MDKRNIRTVIHYSEPPSVEAYIQEAGRGGRDGQTAEAILIHSANSGGRAKARESKNGAQDAEEEERNRLREVRQNAFLEYASALSCRRAFLHRLMGSELSSPCSGCDICDGSAEALPEGLGEILDFFGRNRGRFTLRQSVKLLCQPMIASLGRASPDFQFQPDGRGERDTGERAMRSFLAHPPTCAEAGALSGWQEREALAFIRETMSMGILKSGTGILSKNKLYLDKANAKKVL